MAQPELTVFVPVFNAVKYVDEAVASVLNQTGPSFELLLIDDGSTDGSLEKLQLWERKDKRVRLLKNDANKGVSFTSNRAIVEADGKYLLRLDADDVSLPGRHTRQHRFLETGNVEIIGSAIRIFGGVAVQDIGFPKKDGEIKAKFMACANNIANPASCFNLSFVRKHQIRFDEDLVVAEDLNFWIDCMIAGAKFLNLADVLVAYRIHEKQTGHNIERLRGAQTLTRRRLFKLWYPQLDDDEIEQVLILFAGGSYPKQQVLDALATMQKVITMPSDSMFGEERKGISNYLFEIQSRWQAAMSAVPA